jgi:hypothetical protein
LTKIPSLNLSILARSNDDVKLGDHVKMEAALAIANANSHADAIA